MYRYFTDLDFRWAMQGGLKCCRFVMPEVETRRRKSRRDSVRIELRCNVRIESNRKVPQTNRLSLGVLGMDDLFSEASMLTCHFYCGFRTVLCREHPLKISKELHG